MSSRTSLLLTFLLLAAAALPSRGLAADPEAKPAPAASRLSPVDFKVFGQEQSLAGRYRFEHPITGESVEILLAQAPAGEEGFVGRVPGGDGRILTLLPKREGVGWEGELLGLLESCGQDRVPIIELLPLGEKVVLRLDAKLSELPCPFLEDRDHARLVVAPTTRPVPLRDAHDIVSERTREQIGLAGQPGGVSTPIVAGSVSVEGGTELKFISRTRSLDGSIWIEVEALVSPVAGIEPPRGFMRSGELRVDASLTLERMRAPRD